TVAVVVTIVALLAQMEVGGNGVDLFGLYVLALLLNLAGTLWAMGVALRLRSQQAAPGMQMPVFLLLFFPPVYVPLNLLQGWIHGVASVNPPTALPDAWPTPQKPPREPGPRVEDLPVADQGYEQESVKAAFESFYRNAAQLDAALRTLEAVDSFHRQAASLRTDLRALRAAGWTKQSWTQPPSYGYGMRAPREGVPPALWRLGGEVGFLVAGP